MKLTKLRLQEIIREEIKRAGLTTEVEVRYPYQDPRAEEPERNKPFLFKTKDSHETVKVPGEQGWAIARAAAKNIFNQRGLNSMDDNILTFSPSAQNWV